MLAKLLLNFDTLWKLKLINILKVFWHKFRIKIGIHPVQKLNNNLYGKKFFQETSFISTLIPSQKWKDEMIYFGYHKFPLKNKSPNWHENPFTGKTVKEKLKSWWLIKDFSDEGEDIKIIWEASRMDWSLSFAQQVVVGNSFFLELFNSWLEDWCKNNEAYKGVNWKCGQECSIRVLHLLLAWKIMNYKTFPREELINLIVTHLERIDLTTSYAISQDNNHGTSEAAALFIGGTWLNNFGIVVGKKWINKGRKLLENRVSILISVDGSFSQHSINYHRLLLDTLSLAELWRQWYELPLFSKIFYKRAQVATQWLENMTDPNTGYAPNLGSNDGTNLLPLTDSKYEDFRPCVQLASTLFNNISSYSCPGLYDNHIFWLGLKKKTLFNQENKKNEKLIFHSKGYITMKYRFWKVIFRYPFYKFRPSHSDSLHVDLWYQSTNILNDAGTFGYNKKPEITNYFTGPEGHNVVQFDKKDLMPNITRFLKGSWLCSEVTRSPEQLNDGSLVAAAKYVSKKGHTHSRDITLNESGIKVIDEFSGFDREAVLRWRLGGSNWILNESKIYNDKFKILIETNLNIHIKIVEGWISNYYLDRKPIQVLEIFTDQPGNITTHIKLNL